jgi:putative DNA primase/helicase
MDKFSEITVNLHPDTDFNDDYTPPLKINNDVLDELLNDITEINIREIISLPDGEDIKQKHILIAVVKHVLTTARIHKWSLCQAWGYVYVYNRASWKQYGKEDMRAFLIRCAVKAGVPEYEASFYEFGDKLLKQFMSDAHLPAPEQNKDTILINLQNGTAEFNNNEFRIRDFDQKDFLRYQLPFSYDVDATCPTFDKYLHRVLPHESSRQVLQEYLGFVFTKFNLEKCLVLLGPGSNGKSVLFNIANALFGKENVLNYSLGLFHHEYNRAKLLNVLLNYSSEKGFDLHPDTFKALVSGEPLQAREPYGKPFTIHNPTKFIINCNELPRETESTEAYFRRFIILPFTQVIGDAEKDINLADKIINNELPGVFNWVINGLLRIKSNKRFTHCDQSDNALKEFRKQSDSCQLWVEEFEYSPGPHKTALAELYNEYKQFCKDDNYRPLGKNRFSTRLEAKGFERSRLNNGGAAFFMNKGVTQKNVF